MSKQTPQEVLRKLLPLSSEKKYADAFAAAIDALDECERLRRESACPCCHGSGVNINKEPCTECAGKGLAIIAYEITRCHYEREREEVERLREENEQLRQERRKEGI